MKKSRFTEARIMGDAANGQGLAGCVIQANPGR